MLHPYVMSGGKYTFLILNFTNIFINGQNIICILLDGYIIGCIPAISDSEILAISSPCSGVSDIWVILLSEMMMISSLENNLECKILIN